MPYTHNINPDPYPVGVVLTSADPEPCGGHIVRDATGRAWERTSDYEGPANWSRSGPDDPYAAVRARPEWSGDVETWTHVAGNFGPVTVELAADAEDLGLARRWLE